MSWPSANGDKCRPGLLLALSTVAHYGESGCLTPALSMDYLTRHIQPGGKMRTVIADKQFGYHYFDLEYLEG